MKKYYTREKIERELVHLKKNLNLINNTYFGKQGCACGCRGTYSKSNRSKLIAINKIYKLAVGGEYIIKSTEEENAGRTGLIGQKILPNEGMITLELESRAIRIYYKI